MKHFPLSLIVAAPLLVLFLLPEAVRAVDRSPTVSIEVDAASDEGELHRIWRYFGADEPNYAYMKDGRKLLGQLGELAPGEVFFRTHNLMNTGPGAPALKWGSTGLYSEDVNGSPVYDYRIVDLIFDTYIENGVRPYVQLGFMPQAMSTTPDPYKHQWRPGMPYDEVFTGWAYPPKDFEKWGELVYQWTKHCVERYGREEVERWWWQTWNESNIGYWRGTDEELHKLHDFAMAGVLRALPTARIGGPDTAGHGGDFTRSFFRHCLDGTNYATGEKGTRLDFVSFHAKGSPRWVGDHIRMGISNQLRTIDAGFGIVAEFPQLRNTPIVIGESDPEGCAACQGDQFSYRNGTMYSSYTAASFARKHDLAKKHGVNLEGALTWAFTFEDQPYFAGFRQLASNGLAMPVLNVFRMMSKMKGQRITATSSHAIPLDEILKKGVRESADVAAFSSRTDKQTAIMIWHYHDDDLRGPNAIIHLSVKGIPNIVKLAEVTHYRVDEFHSNSYDAWRRMGSPVAPGRKQYAELESASNLATIGNPVSIAVKDGDTALSFELPRQGVSLVLLDYK
ncbi:Beta-xylosidase [Planctomycetes bacterium CA13]|uniref:Beta-xylosidase n=1 Tax=Novipirellula herctigrandis TaxID=2527986 RepID=A0A5C5YVV5_9BACT|nr:Beta-xylosidase [Planctomycetes bacterium CA13]